MLTEEQDKEEREKLAAVRSRPKPLCPKCREEHNKLKDKLRE